MATVTSPVLTDATGANIVTKLEAIKNAVQPTNACTDIDITIPASGWSGESPYTYTYTTAHVTPGCSVKVAFLEGAENTSVFYLEYEKVSTGVRFTAPSVPASDIPVRIHILAADAESVAATSADQVTTNAVLGASNVQQALGTLNDQIARYVDVEVTLGTTEGNTNVDIVPWSGNYKMLSATLLYNDNLYYAVFTDNRQITLTMRTTGIVTIMQKGGPWSGSRTVTVRVHYA